jgi:calpain, invertebrate
LGNCWFISALSVLATRDELIRGGIGSMNVKEGLVVNQEIAMNFSNGVYPSIFHVYRMKGIFVFRFFKNFKWLYVIVDDRIPTIEDNGVKSKRKAAFGHCKDDFEIWVPLIEKAYAKLHGCYEALVSGYIDDGLTDLTGFVAEKLILHQ